MQKSSEHPGFLHLIYQEERVKKQFSAFQSDQLKWPFFKESEHVSGPASYHHDELVSCIENEVFLSPQLVMGESSPFHNGRQRLSNLLKRVSCIPLL